MASRTQIAANHLRIGGPRSGKSQDGRGKAEVSKHRDGGLECESYAKLGIVFDWHPAKQEESSGNRD
jgi:hypothetical protein